MKTILALNKKLVWLCLTALLWPAISSAHTSEDILSLAVTNYTGYVIDSDGNFPSSVYNRDAIRVAAQVKFTTTNNLASTFEYQLQFRLVDSQSNAVPLVVGFGQSSTVIVSDSVTLPAIVQTSTRNYGAALKPATRLNPYEQYRIELKLYERPGGLDVRFDFTDDAMSTAPASYYHFTNTVSGDARINVIATLDDATVTRHYAVKTISAKNSFTVSTAYHLRRYDDFYAQPDNASVAVHLNYELVDANTGTTIPLVTTNKVVNRAVPGFVFGTPYQPANLTFNDTLDLEPGAGVQLDSVNHSYFARVTIAHVDLAGQPPETGNQLASANQRLLHFNGHLYFDLIDTIFTSIDNVPDVGFTLPDNYVFSHLGVNNNSGYIAGYPAHTYGDGTNLSVRLLANGNAYLASGTVNVNEPNPDSGAVSEIQFERQNMVLDSSGVHGDVTMTLPTGFGYRGDTAGRRLNSSITWPAVPLNQQLAPATNLVYDTPLFACEETKPFWIGASSLRWEVSAGRIRLTPTSVQYVRSAELAELDAAPGLYEPDMILKRSNEQYYRFLDAITSSRVIVQADANGHALMSLDVSFAPGQFTAHFPYDVPVKWLGAGVMNILDDQIEPENSSLTSVAEVTNPYDQDCPGCGPGKGQTNLIFVASDNELHFTIDGGLEAQGLVSPPRPLNWGWIGEPGIKKYAQRTTGFSAANFLMAGCFLRGDQTAFEVNDRAGVMLLTGAMPNDLTQLERPGTPDYLRGYADYAGLNFRVGTDGAIQGESLLAGKESGIYDLTGRSKYYTRRSGVSGIHEAVPGTFPSTMTLYGYDFTFDNYGLSYLSSQNEDSRTEGHLHIQSPSNFDQNFKELKFSCVGALEDAKVPSDEAGLYKLLEYWNGDFITLAIKFDRDDSVACDPSVGYLVLGVQGHATYIEEPLFGALGFKSNGNLISADDVSSGEIKLAAGFNSRLKTPNNFKLQGPASELYTLNPVTDAYYNDWEDRDLSVVQGYVNLAASLDVPFFENIKTHIQTSGKTNSPLAAIYLMGGWPNNGYGTAVDNFFTNPEFDTDNTGYPTADGLAEYRNSATEKYHPRAQTSWLGVIDLDYPLDWSSTVRWFKSWQPVGADILVLSVEHKVKYLSAENVELLFGAQADVGGNLTPGIVFKQIDGNFGVLEAFQEAGLSSNHLYIEAGITSMDTLLSPDPHRFFGTLALWHAHEVANFFCQQVADNPIIDFYIPDYFNPTNGTLINALRTMDVENDGMIENMRYRLDDAMLAIDNLRGIIAQPDGSNRVTASVLVGQILRKGDVEFANAIIDLLGDTLNEKIDAYLDEYDSSFDQIDATLLALKNQLYFVRTNLNDGGQFYQEIHELFVQHDADLQNVVAQVQQDVIQFFNGFSPDDLYDLGVGDMLSFILQKIDDRFVASPLAAAIQVAVKQRLYDLDASVREAADTEFALLDTSLRTLVEEAFAWIDKKFQKLLGKLQSVGGAAQVKGYAHINGDSLKLLRLDVSAQMRMPDVMEFAAYFQIKELDSDGTPTECLPLSGRATEVTMGAIDIPVSYSGSTNDALKVTVTTKFTFDPGPTNAPYPIPLLITLGGTFELKGSLTFGTLEVKYLSAGAAFGELENYITAAATVRQGGYEGTGGVFIGRTCTLGFLYWDKDVTAVLGEQLPFTGAYFYGEAWIPIAEVLLGIPSSCMFDISAGAGAGFGVFAEGPTFVAKMLFGMSGEVLCLAKLKATVALAGKANPDGLSLAGRGTLDVAFGPIEGSIDLFMEYANSSWDIDF